MGDNTVLICPRIYLDAKPLVVAGGNGVDGRLNRGEVSAAVLVDGDGVVLDPIVLSSTVHRFGG